MKKLICMLTVLSSLVMFTGCADSSNNRVESSDENMVSSSEAEDTLTGELQSVDFQEFTLQIPEDWTVYSMLGEDDPGFYDLHFSSKSGLRLDCEERTDLSNSGTYLKTQVSLREATNTDLHYVTENGIEMLKSTFEYKSDSDNYSIYCYDFLINNHLYSFEIKSEYDDIIKEIFTTMQFKNNNAVVTTSTQKVKATTTTRTETIIPETTIEKTEEKTETPDESIPKEYANALSKAESYANNMYMSKNRVFTQLTSEYGEGFSVEAAQYAIDNMVADFNENALQKAQSYSDSMYMSKARIYEQLTSEYGESFTAEEAQYAIDNLTADFNYNALQKAKSYQDNMAMSKDRIYEQLVSEYGEHFTPEEAQYAVDNLE